MCAISITSLTDKNGRILLPLISPEGQNNILDVICYVLEEMPEDRNKKIKGNKRLTINQLRKFYDSFLRIYSATASIQEKKIQYLMLRAISEYSAGRNKTHHFCEFFCNRIDLLLKSDDTGFINNEKALKMHLEAFVAYFDKN